MLRLARLTRWRPARIHRGIASAHWQLHGEPPKKGKTPFFKKKKPILPDHILEDDMVKAVIPLLGKASYVMLAGGFMMTDILYLRILLAGGYTALTTYHIFQRYPLRIPLAGSFFFICVNTGMALLLMKERFWMLDEKQRRIYDEHFASEMSQSDFKKFLLHGSFETCTERCVLVRAGEVSDLVLVLDGCAEVKAESGVINVEKGLIGEVSFLQGGEAAAYVYALPGCRYVHWERTSLLKVLEKSPSTRNGLELKIARDLVNKLKEGTWHEPSLLKELAG